MHRNRIAQLEQSILQTRRYGQACTAPNEELASVLLEKEDC